MVVLEIGIIDAIDKTANNDQDSEDRNDLFCGCHGLNSSLYVLKAV